MFLRLRLIIWPFLRDWNKTHYLNSETDHKIYISKNSHTMFLLLGVPCRGLCGSKDGWDTCCIRPGHLFPPCVLYVSILSHKLKTQKTNSCHFVRTKLCLNFGKFLLIVLFNNKKLLKNRENQCNNRGNVYKAEKQQEAFCKLCS